ncbi:hypothetical protein J3458_009348 [Metarhizium acridum]|uniref:uncharacterized protein n=1 Tax=Metarhizium acridum TaxID=92637 RepID=UPI001C6B4E93|nr:hypothetical protein J3458_009348 [Metarhizium acridum]
MSLSARYCPDWEKTAVSLWHARMEDGAMVHPPKSVKDELIDLVQELPAILEQVVAFRALERVGATKHLEARIIAQCNQLHRDSQTWTQRVPDVLTFDYTPAKPPLLAPRDDAGISLLHLGEIYWIALMILYSVLNFFTQNEHKPRGTEQSVAQHNKDDRGGTLTRVPLSTSPDLHASKCVHAIHLYWGGRAASSSALRVCWP